MLEELMIFLEECEAGVIIDNRIEDTSYVQALLEAGMVKNYFETDIYTWSIKIDNSWVTIEMV